MIFFSMSSGHSSIVSPNADGSLLTAVSVMERMDRELVTVSAPPTPLARS